MDINRSRHICLGLKQHHAFVINILVQLLYYAGEGKGSGIINYLKDWEGRGSGFDSQFLTSSSCRTTVIF